MRASLLTKDLKLKSEIDNVADQEGNSRIALELKKSVMFVAEISVAGVFDAFIAWAHSMCSQCEGHIYGVGIIFLVLS